MHHNRQSTFHAIPMHGSRITKYDNRIARAVTPVRRWRRAWIDRGGKA